MSTNTHPTTVALKFSSWSAALAVVAGVMALVGWTFDIAVLKSILPGWVSMKANTATCFILIGIALWLTARPQSSILDPRSSILDPRSSILDPRSSILDPQFSLPVFAACWLGWSVC